MTRLPARFADDILGLLGGLATQVLDHVDVCGKQRLKRVVELVGDLGRVASFGEEQARERVPEVVDRMFPSPAAFAAGLKVRRLQLR